MSPAKPCADERACNIDVVEERLAQTTRRLDGDIGEVKADIADIKTAVKELADSIKTLVAQVSTWKGGLALLATLLAAAGGIGTVAGWLLGRGGH